MKTNKSRKKRNVSIEPQKYGLTIAIFPFLCLLLIGLIKGTHFQKPSIIAVTILILIFIDIIAFAVLFIFSSKEPKNPAIPQFYIFFLIGICLQLFLIVGMAQLNIVSYHQKVFKTFLLFIFNFILLGLFCSYYLRNKESLQKKRGYLLYFVLYFLFILIQYIVSFFTKAVSYDIQYYLANYSFLIIFSLFFYLYLKDLHDIKILLLLFQFFIVAVFVWSIVDLANMIAGSIINDRPLTVASIILNLRPKLSFGNTNYFAGYLIGFLPLILTTPYLLMTRDNSSLDDSVMIKKGFFKVMVIILSVIIIFPLLLTQTTASFFGFYVGFVFLALSMVMVFAKDKKFMLLGAGVIVFIVIPILLALFAPDIVKPIMPRLAFKLKHIGFSLYDRMNGWAGGIELFKEYPLFGAGLGSVYAASFKYSHKYYYIYSNSNSFKHSHNEYVEILGEAGIFGMVFFALLVGFVVVSLIRNAFFNKTVTTHYKVIALAVVSGIISMLVQQIFSLTLRMSVTMTAFFSLLGIGIFLIYFARINKPEEEKPASKGWFHGLISTRGYYILFAVVAVALIGSFILFLPLFRSENMIIRSLITPQYELRDHYLAQAVKIMPGNPYAWTEKYRADVSNLQSILNSSKPGSNNDQVKIAINEQFAVIDKDLATLDSIIPGYQNMAAKYTQYNMIKTQYFFQEYRQTGNMDYYYKYLDHLPVLFDYLDAALNVNYLDLGTHINKLIFLSLAEKEGQVFSNAVSDYVRARLLLTYCRNSQRIKDNVTINLNGTENKLTTEGDKVSIVLSRSFLSELEQSIYQVYRYDVVKKTLTERMNAVIKEINEGLVEKK